MTAQIIDMSYDIRQRLYDEMLDKLDGPTISDSYCEGLEDPRASELLDFIDDETHSFAWKAVEASRGTINYI